MTCNEIENRLPAYLEDLLSPEEQKNITEHLASCPRCSRALLDLKHAEQLVRGLEEVEPPPFFEQGIMSRIREEAGQKQGILGRLFYPLHIKVPIQALATLLIAVLAFYVYQAGNPEMKRMTPLPIPLAEPEKDQVKAEPPKAVVPPSAVTPVKRAPAGDFPEKGLQRSAAPPFENGGKGERMADSRAPVREERPAVKSEDKVMAAREKGGSPAGAVALGQAQDRAGKPDAGQAPETPLPEQKQKKKMANTGAAAGESQKTMSAPSPSRTSLERSGVSMRVLWRVSEYKVGRGAVWGEEEAHTLLFKTLDITATAITFDGKTCSNVFFNKENINTNEYLDHTFHITPQALGIEGETVELVKTNCNLPGFSEYMRLKDRRIVIHINGVFFFFGPEVNY